MERIKYEASESQIYEEDEAKVGSLSWWKRAPPTPYPLPGPYLNTTRYLNRSWGPACSDPKMSVSKEKRSTRQLGIKGQNHKSEAPCSTGMYTLLVIGFFEFSFHARKGWWAAEPGAPCGILLEAVGRWSSAAQRGWGVTVNHGRSSELSPPGKPG